MKILKGGSLEVERNNWKKFDIELDESDLQAIVIATSLDYAQLTVVQKYSILVKQAEIFVAVQMEMLGGVGEKSVATLASDLKTYLSNLPKAV